MSKPRAKYRASRPIVASDAPKPRRWPRRLIWIALLIGYAAVMWYFVFPWVDQTFVNRPAV